MDDSFLAGTENLSEYGKTRETAQHFYANSKPVMSPALNEKVVFSPEGFNHAVFKKARKERNRSDQIARFKLLPRAARLIGHANTFQEFEETFKSFSVKTRKKRELRNRKVFYWGLIAIFEGRKIKVVLRRIGDSQVHFWSVIPAWTTNKYRDARFITTMEGSPEED